MKEWLQHFRKSNTACRTDIAHRFILRVALFTLFPAVLLKFNLASFGFYHCCNIIGMPKMEGRRRPHVPRPHVPRPHVPNAPLDAVLF